MAVTEISRLDSQDFGAKLRRLADELNQTVTIALSTGGADILTIDIAVVDGNGDAVAGAKMLDLYMSEAATGIGVTADDYSGDLVASTGAIISSVTAKKHWKIVTAADGTFSGDLTDTGVPVDQYAVVKEPIGSGVVVSAISDMWVGA